MLLAGPVTLGASSFGSCGRRLISERHHLSGISSSALRLPRPRVLSFPPALAAGAFCARLPEREGAFPVRATGGMPPSESGADVVRVGESAVLSAINNTTKWAVSGAALGVLVYHHDIYASWCFIGSIVAAANCKALKKLINQSRPASSQKADPGMPSSHAQSLLYLGTYAALAVLGAYGYTQASVAGSAVIMITALFLTWLRVTLGFHTYPQVFVGGLVGIASANLWLMLGNAAVFPRASGGSLELVIYCTALAAAAGFGVVQVRKELLERAKGK
mmetsp:Transcript_10183/g.32960  ORF Transcript_10183/g.32960 Transcript_10183/m.32960 type:complete len:276 (-) Transcript_10183:73-900(-)